MKEIFRILGATASFAILFSLAAWSMVDLVFNFHIIFEAKVLHHSISLLPFFKGAAEMLFVAFFVLTSGVNWKLLCNFFKV